MKRKLALILPMLLLCISAMAQEGSEESQVNTVEQQFVDVVDKSNSYQEFKVIKKTKINQLRSSILDTISGLETKIDGLNTEIDDQKIQIAKLQEDLKTINEDLAISQKKENGIQFMGSIMEKSTYNSIMWSIIGLLILALVFFIYKFTNSNKITKASQFKLAEVEIEFEKYRQKAIENEQQLGRKLQDEINKNRNS